MKSYKIQFIEETFEPYNIKHFNINKYSHFQYFKIIKLGHSQSVIETEAIDLQTFGYYQREIRRIERLIKKQYKREVNLRSCSYKEAITQIKNARTLQRTMP